MNTKSGVRHRFRTVGLVLGSTAVAFVVFSLYLYPVLVGKRDEIYILDYLDRNLVNLANESDPENSTVEAFNIWYAPENSFGIKETRTVNWSWFWKVFKKNSAWQLEAWHPVDEEWVDNWQGTNLNEWLNISRIRSSDNGSEKVTLTVTNMHPSQDLYFRFKFGIDLRVKEFVNKSSNYEYVLTYPANATENYTVFFNFSDVKPLIQNGVVIQKHGVKEVGGKDIFFFMLTQNMSRNPLPVGCSFEVDPIFGYEAVGGSTINCNANNYISILGNPDSNGIADNITIHMASGWSVGEEIKCLLYNETGIVFHGVTEEKTEGGHSGEWVVFNFSEPKPIIDSEMNYYIGVFADDGITVSRNITAGNGYYREVMTYPNYEDQISSWDFINTSWSMSFYCSYTEGGGEPSLQSISSGWFSSGNLSQPDSITGGFFTSGNNSVSGSISGGFFTSGNLSTSGSISSGWFSSGNVSAGVLQQIFTGFFTSGNLSGNDQQVNGYFTTGNNSVSGSISGGFFTSGNLSTSGSISSGWFSSGNVSAGVLQQITSGWFSSGNISDKFLQQITSGWFSSGNETPLYIVISDEYPGDNGLGIPLQPTAYVTINSTLGNNMNMSWYYGLTSGAETILLGSEINITNGTYTELFYPAIGRITSYYWRIMAEDGTNYVNETFSFTTEDNSSGGQPVISRSLMGAIFIIGSVGFALVLFSIFGRNKKKKIRR